jgi:hypothetical protein
MTRREFTKAQKAEMIRRASDAKGNIFCEGCGLNVTGKQVEFDHTIPEALILDKSRKLTADDGKMLGRDCCHRAPGGKTAQDVTNIARAKRREARHLGIRPKSKFPCSKDSPWRRKLSGEVVPR